MWEESIINAERVGGLTLMKDYLSNNSVNFIHDRTNANGKITYYWFFKL